MDETNINYLLSAMVQSGAALVAIVGGLLGARYVSLHAEKNAAARDVMAAHSASESASDRTKALDRRLTENLSNQFLCVPQFWGTVLDALRPEAELVAEAEDAAVRNGQQLRVDLVVRSIRNIAHRARTLLGPMLAEDPPHASWVAFRRRRSIVTRTPHEDFVFATTYFQMRIDKIASAARPQATEYLTDYRKAVNEEFERLRAEETDLRGKIDSALDREVDLSDRLIAAMTHRDALRESEGFGLAIEVLAMIALATIVVPLLLMVPDVEDYVSATRWALVGLFISGLVLLGWYLAVYSRFIAEKRRGMPNHVWGLFKPDTNRDCDG